MTARQDLDFGHPVLRVARGPFAARIDLRAATTTALLLVAAAALVVLSLGSGSYPVPPPRVVSALLGGEQGLVSTVVLEWRLPRVLLAAAAGAALGTAGAVFQSLTRNPLGSPDVLGFSTGAYTGALVALVLVGGTYLPMAAGAVLGGLGAAALVYLLAYRGGIQGFRLIVVGIGVSAVLGSTNTWIMLRADLEVALSAAVWGAGSLNGTGWEQTLPALVLLAALALLLVPLSRPLHQLELGDDAARALGTSVEPARLSLLVLGVALTSVVTAAVGPIGFVALVAPQVARRLARTAGVTLLPSAATGAVLLLAADWVAQHGLGGTVLPVGVVTVTIGGLYLVGLLVREARRTP